MAPSPSATRLGYARGPELSWAAPVPAAPGEGSWSWREAAQGRAVPQGGQEEPHERPGPRALTTLRGDLPVSPPERPYSWQRASAHLSAAVLGCNCK